MTYSISNRDRRDYKVKKEHGTNFIQAWFLVAAIITGILVVQHLSKPILDTVAVPVAHAESKPNHGYSMDNKGSCERLRDEHPQVLGASMEETIKRCAKLGVIL